MQIKADLHVHTNASDGDLSPYEVVMLAKTQGLSAVAVTDHDTTSGLSEAMDGASELGMTLIPGVEISAAYDPGTLHVLGYFSEIPSGLEKSLSEVQQARARRNPKIIEKLNELGMQITLDDVMQIAGDAQIGRPHIAKALINNGSVKNFEEAFSRYLAKGKPAYVDKKKMTWDEAVALIKAHGGVSILAHPFTLCLDANELRSFVGTLAAHGMSGIEVYYPEHTKAQKKLYASIARSLNLLTTGGTDFHG
ncbi:MAG: PHP domain-containing protein, partial [Deltaproteobacteria bacterium]|nr:PHP domain-containing protein [Deltaproteobacteria bacterium]